MTVFTVAANWKVLQELKERLKVLVLKMKRNTGLKEKLL